VDSKKLANRSNFFLFIIVVLGFLGVANYLAYRMFFRMDLTENKIYTISKATKRVLRNVDDVVTFKVFISESNLPPLAINLTRQIRDLLSEYEAHSGGNVAVTYADPTDDPELKSEARSLGLQEVPMQIIEKDRQQNVMCFMGLAILYGDKKEIMPVLNNVGNLEYDLTSRIIKVTRTEVKKVGFYFGNGKHEFSLTLPGQQPPRGPDNKAYNTIKRQLKEQFEVVEVYELENGTPVPADLTTLVVAGPKTLNDREKFEIDQFVMQGGKLIMLVNSVSVQTTFGLNASKEAHNTGDLLSHYGAKVNQNLVYDASHASISYQVNYGGFMLPIATPYPLWVRLVREGFNQDIPAVSGMETMTLMWVSSVEPTLDTADTAVEAIAILSTTPYGKAQENVFDLNPRKKWGDFRAGGKKFDLAISLTGEFSSFFDGKTIPQIPDLSDTTGEGKKAATGDSTRTRVERSPNTSIVVMGDSDFLVDGSPRENFIYMNNLVEWLSLGNDLISIRTKGVTGRFIDPKISTKKKTTIRTVNTMVMPLLVAVFGMAIFTRRRKIAKKGASV